MQPETGIIEYEELRKQALIFSPAMILCGASAYPRTIDFARFRAIAHEVGAILMADIAHISGLVATKQHPSPFEHCDVVTTTTHKSLRGLRAGMIFFKYSEAIPDIKERIDMAVFPALQGGLHNHQIGALAAQLLEVNTPEFVEYSKTVVSNAGTFAEALIAKGHKLASGRTDNHLVLWDLRPHGLTGSKVRRSLNRNTVPGDASALSSGGVRIGAPAMTTRGCTTEDFKMIADFLHRCASIALELGVGLKFRRDRRGSPQVLQVHFAAMWDSLDVPAPCDCSSAIKPKVSAVCPSAITWASRASPSRCSSSISYLTNSSE